MQENNEQETKRDLLIAVIISSELYRPILIKSLLSHRETDNLITRTSIHCSRHIKQIIQPEIDLSEKEYREKVIQWARNYIFIEHNIKV